MHLWVRIPGQPELLQGWWQHPDKLFTAAFVNAVQNGVDHRGNHFLDVRKVMGKGSQFSFENPESVLPRHAEFVAGPPPFVVQATYQHGQMIRELDGMFRWKAVANDMQNDA